MADDLNDNDVARVHGAEPDAHGQAALLLTESLLHGLIERGVIGVRDAVEIVEAAADVKQEIAADVGESKLTMQRSLAILKSIEVSLAADLNEEGAE